MKTGFSILVFFLLTITLFAQESEQTFLSLNDTGVEEFITQHPEYDGRGTIIIVLDTGVDMGVDGLIKTSTGETKVIDVQDFTGQGDVKLFNAEKDEEDGRTYFVNDEVEYKVQANLSSMLASMDNNYFIGAFPEKQLMNSGSESSDLNGNGNTDDVYYLLAYNTKDGYWVVYFDLNGNGDLSDDKPLRSYKENFDAFSIKHPDGLTPFTMGLNIFPEEKRVSFFFDDGGHGTHCAGIASGYNIFDSGFNGVAPGSKIIALKIGNNNFTGGATVTESMKKAYQYADKISRELKEPCIISMSFGVGSEIEGKSEIEKFLADLAKQNPYLYISTSNGNEGPGISTAGLPSSSSYIFSSGAVLTKETARDNYGNILPYDIILHFSSRGGEVNKPDVVAPGAATSTVPNFDSGERKWGTSMSCPYSSGVMALLLSAAQKEFPNIKIPSRLLYKILKQGAVPRKEYTVLDQGAGFINVPNSYEVLKKYLKNGEQNKFETYTTSSIAPNQPDGRAENLYLRDGSFLTGEEVLSFSVKRENTIKSDKFYRVYNLKCESDWLKLIQKKIYIRNDQSTAVNFKVDKSKMTEPGLYTTKIIGQRDDASKFPDLEMLATIVIPFEFNEANNYQMFWNNKVVAPGMIQRYFIKVPAGQTTMKVTLSRDTNSKKYSRIRYIVNDNDGFQLGWSRVLYSVNNDEKVENNYYNLNPGIYEIDIDGFFLAADSSTYNLEVAFLSLEADKNEVSNENNKITFVNYFNTINSYSLNGELSGLQRNYVLKVDGKATYKMPFVIKKGEASKSFAIELSKEDFNKITDFSYQILDESGKALSLNALSNKIGDAVEVSLPAGKDSSNFIFELIPGFVSSDMTADVSVKEITYFPSSIPVDVRQGNRNILTLYPNMLKPVTVNYSKPEISIPVDSKGVGKIYFKNTGNGNTEYELPIYFKF